MEGKSPAERFTERTGSTLVADDAKARDRVPHMTGADLLLEHGIGTPGHVASAEYDLSWGVNFDARVDEVPGDARTGCVGLDGMLSCGQSRPDPEEQGADKKERSAGPW
jgi:hypothetical protein